MTKRLSVTLGSDDDRLVSAFGAPGTSEFAALRTWADQRGWELADSPSEAALLRLLVRAGAEALREHTLDLAYAQLRVEIDADHTLESRAARDRHVRRTERHRAG